MGATGYVPGGMGATGYVPGGVGATGYVPGGVAATGYVPGGVAATGSVATLGGMATNGAHLTPFPLNQGIIVVNVRFVICKGKASVVPPSIHFI